MAIFFTSDLHLNHANSMKFCPAFRNFSDVETMNDHIINTWNGMVKPTDIVYNLGDVVFAKTLKDYENILERLNGQHHLILGNHDVKIRQNKEYFLRRTKQDGNPLISSIQDYLRLDLDQTIIMFHYPIEEWDKCHRGSYHLCGHIHDKQPKTKGRILNVCYDNWGKLVPLEEVVKILDNEPILNHF